MATTLVAIGTRKGLWLARSEDRRTWTLDGPHHIMNEVASVAIDTRGATPRILAGVMSWHWGPTVNRSDDLGASWQGTENSALKFPEDTDTALKRTWQLVPDPIDDDVIWAGTEPQALFRSGDRGETFELNRGLWEHPHRSEWGEGAGGGAIHTILPHPLERDRMLVAMSTGGVYSTTDGGEQWSASNAGVRAYFMPDNEYPEFGQCVHKVARAAGAPDRLYLQNHHGVNRSDDGGSTWVSIADGLPTDFGFVCVTHPSDPDRLWLVPIQADSEHLPAGHRLQVQTSTDGGATWHTLTGGLPDPSYTCVLRDAADTDGAPDGPDGEGAGFYFGTRNGEVYAGLGEGADMTFTAIATQLPDVLCLRAATIA